jgi:hypothetical protein
MIVLGYLLVLVVLIFPVLKKLKERRKVKEKSIINQRNYGSNNGILGIALILFTLFPNLFIMILVIFEY